MIRPYKRYLLLCLLWGQKQQPQCFFLFVEHRILKCSSSVSVSLVATTKATEVSVSFVELKFSCVRVYRWPCGSGSLFLSLLNYSNRLLAFSDWFLTETLSVFLLVASISVLPFVDIWSSSGLKASVSPGFANSYRCASLAVAAKIGLMTQQVREAWHRVASCLTPDGFDFWRRITKTELCVKIQSDDRERRRSVQFLYLWSRRTFCRPYRALFLIRLPERNTSTQISPVAAEWEGRGLVESHVCYSRCRFLSHLGLFFSSLWRRSI